jgi:hypothetical protein
MSFSHPTSVRKASPDCVKLIESYCLACGLLIAASPPPPGSGDHGKAAYLSGVLPLSAAPEACKRMPLEHILSISYDEPFLVTRQLILEAAGYERRCL